MIKNQCEVCKESDHKYRCPQCRIMYCSVGCFKIHKETCQTLTEEKTETPVKLKDKSDTQVPDFTLKEEESEDKVDEDKLRLLGESSELKEVLANTHLRQIMTSLVHSENPTQALEEAMHEPIFTEFADTCLSIVVEKDNSSCF